MYTKLKVFSRPGGSQGLLYKHLRHSLRVPSVIFFSVTISLNLVGSVGSCTLSGFKSLVCEMFTNHQVHAENHAVEPQKSPCYV